MRVPALIAGASLVLAACGSSPATSTDSVDGTLPPTTTPVTKVPRTTVPSTDVVPPTTIEPGTNPNATEQPTQPGSVAPFSLADALLPDDALPPPWEFQRRDPDRVGYGSGPNQTTCAEYWAFESLLGRDGAYAMWWRDGGNANHHVIQMPDEGELLSLVMDLFELPDACPVVKWIEGGSFTTERIELGDGIGLRFEDQESGDTTFVVVTANDALLSVLHMPLWTATDGAAPEMSVDELSRLATLMYERATSVDLTEIPEIVPATTAPPNSTTPPQPTNPPRPPATTEPPVEPSGLAELLLTADDLPDGWELDDIGAYVHNTGDDTFDDCAAAESIDIVDVVLEWEASFTTTSGRGAFELIGEFESAAEAVDVVEMFAEVAACDVAITFADAVWSGGLEEVPSADRAARLTAEIEDEDFGGRFDLMLMAVDSIVMVVSYEGPNGDDGAALYDLAERAAAKAAAG